MLAHTPLPIVPDPRVLAHTTPDPPVVCSPMTPNHRGLGRRALTLLSLHSTGPPVGERGGTHHYTIALRRLPAFPTIATTGPVNPLSDRGTLLRVVHRTPPENTTTGHTPEHVATVHRTPFKATHRASTCLRLARSCRSVFSFSARLFYFVSLTRIVDTFLRERGAIPCRSVA